MKIQELVNENIIYLLANIPTDKEYAFVIRNERFLLLENYSVNPDNVLIDESLILPDDIVGHTHYSELQAGRFSLRDIKTSILNKRKILLYHTKFQEWDYFDPNYYHPYPLLIDGKVSLKSFMGLRYEPVRCDCYSFCRDVAKTIYGLELPDLFSREMKYNKLKYFFVEPEKLGFKRTNSFKPGNFVLLNLSVEIPFHMGILIGDKVMLHSLSDKQPTGIINVEGLSKNLLGVYSYG